MGVCRLLIGERSINTTDLFPPPLWGRVRVGGRAISYRRRQTSRAPPPTPPQIKAFTPVFAGYWGRGGERGISESYSPTKAGAAPSHGLPSSANSIVRTRKPPAA